MMWYSIGNFKVRAIIISFELGFLFFNYLYYNNHEIKLVYNGVIVVLFLFILLIFMILILF